jgi:hypothetical protein
MFEICLRDNGTDERISISIYIHIYLSVYLSIIYPSKIKFYSAIKNIDMWFESK